LRLELTPALAAGLVCLALAWAGEPVSVGLAYDRQAILSGELWRLWTAHAVHFSPQHALADTLALAVLATLAERLANARTAWVALVAGPPLISLGLLAVSPGLQEYRGASGLAVMMAVLCAGLLWSKCGARGKCVLTALATLLLGKTVAEACGGSSGVAGLPSGVVVAWQAHVLGAACAVALLAWRQCFGRVGSPSPRGCSLNAGVRVGTGCPPYRRGVRRPAEGIPGAGGLE
jgi:rhomboid family GlyGly-CTERM serine protease